MIFTLKNKEIDMKEYKFKKDTWYELKYTFCGKPCNTLEKSTNNSSDRLDFKEYYDLDDKEWKRGVVGFSIDKDISNFTAKELSISEVQQYLYDNHPDKLVRLPEEYIVKCDTNAEANRVFEEVYGYDNSHYITMETIILVDSATKLQPKGSKGRAYWSTIPSFYQHYPVFSYETWTKLKDMKEEFKLPEFWQIERNTENNKIINDWMNIHHNTSKERGYYTDCNGWVNNRNLHKSIYQRDMPEITFEQFKKYIIMKDKKIIGYKCPTDLFEGEIKKGTVYNGFPEDSSHKGTYFSREFSSPKFNIPKEIVETWEPVYEEEESINLNFGDTRVTVKKGQGYIGLQEGNITKAELKQIIDHFSKGPKMLGYEGKADKVIYGCKNGTLDELVKIYNTI